MTNDITTHERWMARALELARRGINTTHPNPRVGCVLVQGDTAVGEGWHERAGGPHAERMALDAAGAHAKGATAYVTLEPCGHTGQTPPCVDALIAAQVQRVVFAAADADPRTAGQSAAKLKAAGIAVTQGVLTDEARALNRGFFSRFERGRPWVTLKLAASLDGRTAMASGESQWITGAEARADVHRWRAGSSVVLTGIGTVLADDPKLTARGEGITRQPLRVVLDSAARTPPQALVRGDDGQCLIVHAPGADGAGAGHSVAVASKAGSLDLHAVSKLLAEQYACNDLFVECGAKLAGAWLQSGLVDTLVLYLAPKLLGDAGRGLVALPGLDQLADAINLEGAAIKQIGPDWRIIARPVLAA